MSTVENAFCLSGDFAFYEFVWANRRLHYFAFDCSFESFSQIPTKAIDVVTQVIQRRRESTLSVGLK